jgi:hypothetical protein
VKLRIPTRAYLWRMEEVMESYIKRIGNLNMATTARKTERMVSQDGNGRVAAPSTANEREISMPSEEHIALLAYSYWESRGCPIGSPDEDWLRAEHDILQDEQNQSA